MFEFSVRAEESRRVELSAATANNDQNRANVPFIQENSSHLAFMQSKSAEDFAVVNNSKEVTTPTTQPTLRYVGNK